MTILFMGGEMGAFVPSDSNAIESTDNYDTAFARCSLRATGSATYNDAAVFTETANIWLHFDVAQGGSSTTNSTKATLCSMLNSSGTEVFRLTASYAPGGSTTAWQLQYSLAGVWTNLGSAFSLTQARQTIDVHLVANSASGAGTVYVSGTQRSSGAADLSSISGVAKFREYGISPLGAATVYISQVIASTTSTIGGRLFTVPLAGAGSDSAWTGTYLNIDEVAYSDADFINSATANQVSTFVVTAPALTGYQVQAVGVSARANCGSGGPQHLQLALRSSGTNYFSGSKTLDPGYGAFVNIWETDPATSAAWTNTAAAAIQPGVKSIA